MQFELMDGNPLNLPSSVRFQTRSWMTVKYSRFGNGTPSLHMDTI